MARLRMGRIMAMRKAAGSRGPGDSAVRGRAVPGSSAGRRGVRTWAVVAIGLTVAWIPSAGCAHSPEMKSAARMQLESLREAEAAARDYIRSVDRLLERGQAIRDEAKTVTVASAAVDEAVAIDDVIDASDTVARAIFGERRRQAGEVGPLEELRRRHRENLSRLVELLSLLAASQALIVEYVLTDVGPEPSRIEEISARLRSLTGEEDASTDAGGGSAGEGDGR